MKARILYNVDDTTTELVLIRDKITTQILPDGRGFCRVYNEDKLVRVCSFKCVYLIDLDVVS